MSSCGCRPSNPDSGSKPAAKGGSSTSGCTACTITSKTVKTSPANRARTRIGVGEEVVLTVNPGPATWTRTSGGGSLSPSRGSHTAVYYTAGDTAGNVTITAKGKGCTCTITLTVVEPSGWTMKKKLGTNLKHTNGRPDCGWKGIMYVHPNDVNFYNIETREKDSKCVATGSHSGFNNLWHGNYGGPDKASAWFPITSHSTTDGSTDNVPDTIHTGDPGATATRAAPPFTVGSHHYPITMQWKVGAGSVKDFPVKNHEAEIFANGRCEMRKGGNTEHTMYNDPTSTY